MYGFSAARSRPSSRCKGRFTWGDLFGESSWPVRSGPKGGLRASEGGKQCRAVRAAEAGASVPSRSCRIVPIVAGRNIVKRGLGTCRVEQRIHEAYVFSQ